MTYKEALRRAVATFVFGALSSPVAASVLEVEAWKAAAAAGLAALVNWVFRTVEAYVSTFEDA